MTTLDHITERVGPPLAVGVAGLLFAIPTVALLGFAALAAGWIAPGAF